MLYMLYDLANREKLFESNDLTLVAHLSKAMPDTEVRSTDPSIPYVDAIPSRTYNHAVRKQMVNERIPVLGKLLARVKELIYDYQVVRWANFETNARNVLEDTNSMILEELAEISSTDTESAYTRLKEFTDKTDKARFAAYAWLMYFSNKIARSTESDSLKEIDLEIDRKLPAR
jgi:hypothetical protein